MRRAILRNNSSDTHVENRASGNHDYAHYIPHNRLSEAGTAAAAVGSDGGGCEVGNCSGGACACAIGAGAGVAGAGVGVAGAGAGADYDAKAQFPGRRGVIEWFRREEWPRRVGTNK